MFSFPCGLEKLSSQTGCLRFEEWRDHATRTVGSAWWRPIKDLQNKVIIFCSVLCFTDSGCIGFPLTPLEREVPGKLGLLLEWYVSKRERHCAHLKHQGSWANGSFSLCDLLVDGVLTATFAWCASIPTKVPEVSVAVICTHPAGWDADLGTIF